MRAGLLTIRVLGPFEASMDGATVAVPAGRLRALLARLAVTAGETVSVERLAEAAWDDELPENARRTVQIYITRLRALVGKDLIQTRPAGYALRVPADQVDALRFAGLLDAAAAETGSPQEGKLLREALALWRGRPFEGIGSSWLAESEAPSLVERYLSAVERRLDLDIASGHAADLVAELAELTAEHPLRETLWVRWLVALAACDRQAEALERYEAVRSLLAEELGVDPGPELRAAHADLLAGRFPSANGAGPARRVPRQLPADIPGFTGRRPALRKLAALLGGGDGHTGGTVTISAIQGTAGIGKSALAIHAAHRLLRHYPGGQLYVDLQGATPGLQPLASLEVLGRFLRALGMDPGAVPAGEAEASARFRSEAAGRRMLVVLDNAADAGQVRPLLPGSGCGVLVTSRHVLPTLEGARHLHLDVLTPAEATGLLGRLAGPERVAAEPEAAAEIARLCGWLPLALRIAGARLAARPRWPLRSLAERLAGAHRRLDELELAEVSVRASFAVSFEQLRASGDPLDRAAAGAFGLLGTLDGPDVGVAVVARLLDRAEPETERALERLVDAQLLATPAPGRYRLHDLLRLYAREVAGQQYPESARAAALTRALGFYVATAWHTLELLRPGDHRLSGIDGRWREGGLAFAGAQAALGWLEAERANLLAAAGQAASVPGVPARMAVQLAQAMFAFHSVRSLWHDQVRVNRIALRVARREGDRAAQAQAHYDLGIACEWQGHYERALASLRESLAIRRELGDRRGQGDSLNGLGLVHGRQGHYERALASLQESLAIRRELGDRRGQAITRNNLGLIYRRQGRDEDALASLREALAIYQELGDRMGRAGSLITFGEVCERQGRYHQALACHSESLAIYRELGDREGQAYNLNDLGVLHRSQGRYDQALACHSESLAIRRELDDPYGQAESLRDLGITLHAAGRPAQARPHWLEALAIFERLRTAEAGKVRALLATLPQDD